MKNITCPKQTMLAYIAFAHYYIRCLKDRFLLRRIIAFILLYSVVFQAVLVTVPQVQARPQQNIDGADQGYFSNFTDRVSELLAGYNTGSSEIGLPGVTVTPFGPKRFTRTNGAPNNYVETFTMPTACTNGTYKIIIRNGEPEGTHRISSA